jgi:nitrous oxide reductase accessory protein NosL
MWARTWTLFENAEGRYAVCSLHCLADICRKSEMAPEHVQAALYLNPAVLVPAEEAFFVVGSRARGTMTKKSKLAFADRRAAVEFAADCGGQVTTWKEAYALALAGLERENPFISAMRMKKGKIVEPKDRIDECAVCRMYPARYGKHRAQIRTPAGQTVHFCSTQCLFKYLQDPRRAKSAGAASGMIWVTDYASGQWISAKTAYYVVGADMWGPMGYEAFAFDTRSNAEAFVGAHGGRLLPFSQIRIEEILSAQ